jgi:spore coat protein I
MNDRSLAVLDQYELKIIRSVRGRGGLIIATDNGDKLLLECGKQDKYYRREDVITQAVKASGFTRVDTYVRNTEGEIISELAEEGRKYVLKDMYAGNECNIRNLRDISDAVGTMATLHLALDDAKNIINSGDNDFALANGDIAHNIRRHTKEMRGARNYLKNKKQKTAYEMEIFRNIDSFYNEAQAACEMLEKDGMAEILAGSCENSLIHGNFTYHNVIIGNGGVAVTNMERCRIDSQMMDLYQFMRKILEKYNWDIDLGFRMLNDYDRVKRISDEDLSVLTLLFTFPEKFYKLVNQYHNMNKAWVSPKSIEKLEGCVEGNARRLDFVATLVGM